MKRGNPHPHKYKYGKQKEQLRFEDFQARINVTNYVDPIRDKAFTVLLYYLGCRITALLKLQKEDVKRFGDKIAFKLSPLKHGIRDLPLSLDADLPFMDTFLEWLRYVKEGEYIFPFHYSTGWRIIKRAFPKLYPHFMRLNRATSMLNDPNTTTPEMMIWFAWRNPASIKPYIGYSTRMIDKGSARIRKEVTS